MSELKKLTALFLAAALTASLCACGSGEADAEPDAPRALQDDSAYTLTAGQQEQELALPEGASVALVVDNAGAETGVNAALWQGVQVFGENFGAEVQLFTATAESAEADQTALRDAAESGAELVVCAGADMETPLFELQNNYPTVSYLMLDGEPHSEDHASYSTAANVHCVLFNEEQAGYLAGYAAVADGYTALGFLGAEQMPGIVRYSTGFLQGAQAAAERSGVEATVKIWYCGEYEASDDITARMSSWYNEGTQLIFAVGGTLAQSCVDAAGQGGGRVLTADWDQTALGGAVLGAAVKRYSTVVQNQLYDFYAGGAGWSEEDAGQSERVGVAAGAVGLATAQWGFLTFTQEQYAEVYDRLVSGTLRVERYSDPDPAAMPQMTNVDYEYQN